MKSRNVIVTLLINILIIFSTKIKPLRGEVNYQLLMINDHYIFIVFIKCNFSAIVKRTDR